MSETIFTYNGIVTSILCKKDELMKDIIQKFLVKTNSDYNNLIFLYGGEQINGGLTFNQQAKKCDKDRNKMNVLVYDGNNSNKKNEKKLKSKEIICPECGESCRISFTNYKIKLYKCKNRHKITNIPLNEFSNTQAINGAKIICNDCNKKNKINSYNNEFFKCLTCGKNLCPLCNTLHNKDNKDKFHKIIDYDKKNYICNMHNDLYISYCKQCKINMCMACEIDHNNTHKIINYRDIMINKEKMKEEIKNFGIKIETLKNIIYNIINKLNRVIDNFELYYKINYDIINNFEMQNKNYQTLKNINTIYNNIKINDIDKIINDDNINNKFINILNLSNQIIEKDKDKNNNDYVDDDNDNEDNNKNENDFDNQNVNNDVVDDDNIKKESKNEIIIKYKIDEKNYKMKIFGSGFVKNNEKNCELKIEDNKYKLTDIFIVPNNIAIFKDELEIKLIGVKYITNMRNMFSGCALLLDVPDISEIDTINITDMSYMFSGCSSLKHLPDISKWNIKNVNNISLMFSGCKSLMDLPDISKWDTINIKSISGLFNGCSSLSSLPDISKWNTNNITNMSCLFFGCSSLSSLPDISKWNTQNVNYMNCMFFGCSNLSNIPDISNWNIKNVINMNDIFQGCKSQIKFKSK